ncbi:MAG: condensation domain-containing protein [Actinobacteria bacterium]|nr:condensation domain-containing protein [Acidobacteriota bacterium]MCA1701728.1 condensation domain-containing protein [Actinomycetota bacterium]
MRNAPRIENVLPLTPLQEGLLFHATYDDQTPDVYNVQLVLDLEGPLDPGRLHDAVHALLHRHPTLRASFHLREQSNPVQIIQTQVRTPWHHIDLTDLPEPERHPRVRDITSSDRDQRFSLTNAPLIRFTLVTLTPATHRLLVSNHHILLDGWSRPLLMQELFHLYQAHPGNAELPPVDSLQTYFTWRAGQDRTTAEHAWCTALAGLTEPTRLAPHADTHRTVAPHQHNHHLSAHLTTAITTAARRHGITTYTVIQAIWALLLARITGRDDVVFGTTTAGRPPEIPGIETMIGMFINTVPVRVRLNPAEPLIDMITRLQQEQSQLTSHHHLGLTDIQKQSDIDGELFNTHIVFENYPLDNHAIPGGVRIVGMQTHNTAHYPLSLIAIPRNELTLQFGYRPDLFTRSDIERITMHYVRLIRTFADNPTTKVGAITLVDTEEKRQILVEWNDTARDVAPASVSALFEAQVARTPDNVAVRFNGEALSYAELDHRANELAHLLHERGIGPEDIVALALPRSTEMVVSLLAVLKSGAAYLPIDPDYPTDRIDFMLYDARAALLITTDHTAWRLPETVTPRLLVGAEAGKD